MKFLVKRRKPNQLTNGELLDIVERVRDYLYLDIDGKGEFYSGSKQWDVQTIEDVASVLQDHDLEPAANKRSGS